MRLLIITQEVDRESATLGFFHEWIRALAARASSVSVVCLKEGAHTLPSHVKVYSLYKERNVSRYSYPFTLYKHLWKLYGSYDAVFVHMNEEYVLLAGWWWKLSGVPVFLWRNHYAGSWKTRVAAFFSTKVFYTSDASYTARFKNAVQMPVGVDLSRFTTQDTVRTPRSILFLGRLSPSKKPHVLLEALATLSQEGVSYTASFYGPHTDADSEYVRDVRAKALSMGEQVQIRGALSHADAAKVFATHDIYVNLSDPGMYDKTLLEAAVSGCVVLSSSPDFNALHGLTELFLEPTRESVHSRLLDRLEASESVQSTIREHLRACAQNQSLTLLCDQIIKVISRERTPH